jgi:hypothetical protein
MPSRTEVLRDGTIGGEKPLGMSRRRESLYAPLPLSRGLMRNLRAVVSVPDAFAAQLSSTTPPPTSPENAVRTSVPGGRLVRNCAGGPVLGSGVVMAMVRRRTSPTASLRLRQDGPWATHLGYDHPLPTRRPHRGAPDDRV